MPTIRLKQQSSGFDRKIRPESAISASSVHYAAIGSLNPLLQDVLVWRDSSFCRTDAESDMG